MDCWLIDWIYYKELAHIICGGCSVLRYAVGQLETRECWWCGSSLKVSRFEIQKSQCFSSDHRQEKNWPRQKIGRRNSPLFGRERVSLLFYLGLQLFGWGLLTVEKKICFTQSIDLNIKFFQKLFHRNTVIMTGQESGYPVA